MTDTYIAQIAADQRAAAQQYLGWELDRLRLHAGLVKVVEAEGGEIERPLRRTRRLLDPEVREARFLPLFDGTAVLIRDVEGRA